MHPPLSQSGSQSYPRVSRLVVVGLIAGLVHPVSPAQAISPTSVVAASKPKAARVGAARLNADQRAVHLLSRLSFGPTPDELAAVKRLGVDGWLNQQLHPERISDGALEARLAEFP